jgi:hypothetical protein
MRFFFAFRGPVLVPAGGQLSPYPSPLKKIIFGLRCGQESRQQIQEAAMEVDEGPIQFAEIESVTGSFVLRIRDLDLSFRQS